jgi:ubiquinone/menaquinone biosynthesis C-methylase UbiE
MAPLVGKNGRVYGVDIQPEMIDFLQKRLDALQLTQARAVRNNDSATLLPPNSVDKMLMVDVYHEFAYPLEMARSMLEALKPGGKLFLVEFKAEDDRVPIKPIHKMTAAQAIKELETAGFIFVMNVDNLPWQHCMVFEKP